ncbi:Hypothetical protein ORPV_166 [Orpheovirus IHUMI-LCC2]|uniref:Uncharacterized protein n=1 Tax=Orpheovirus IHUMI-LCC2 TaxID=2023057 RepID=A0A2I2L3I0_9VIRU|nr:Hypothetical protein ORPV_166 [Orpheovirus IHUMI-LCC2]SNW62070.1 Hypothetical protein ORPV_166 [Orpheovirus IHUMI-LCC2]
MKSLYFLLIFYTVSSFCYDVDVNGSFLLKDGTHFADIFLNVAKVGYTPIHMGRVTSIVNNKEKTILESIEIAYKDMDGGSGIITVTSYITKDRTYIVNSTLGMINGEIKQKSYCATFESYKYDNTIGKVTNLTNDYSHYTIDNSILYATHFSLGGLPENRWPYFTDSHWYLIRTFHPINVKTQVSYDKDSQLLHQNIFLYNYVQSPVFENGAPYMLAVIDSQPLITKLYNRHNSNTDINLNSFFSCKFYQDLLSL